MRKYVTVPAAHFHPVEDGLDWFNNGAYMFVSAGSGDFLAPVVFPGSGPVTVRKIILYAYGNNASVDVGVQLNKSMPATGNHIPMAPHHLLRTHT